MTDKTAIVSVTAEIVGKDEEGHARAQEMPMPEDPTAPAVGRWYWVSDEDEDGDKKRKKTPKRWLGCVVTVGSNYAEVSNIRGSEQRIHFDDFWKLCEFEPNPDAYINARIAGHQKKVHALMEEVKEVTARLSITTGPALPGASETQALALRGNEQPVEQYKKALVKAKEKVLPDLFKEIENENDQLASWMKAKLIPLKAQAAAMRPALHAIEQRIFSVELYAGLVESVEQVREGEPAPLTEKIHLMQRRAYMDEECLANYSTGGMEFKDLRAFDRWIAKAENMNRILPFPRTILAFQVRREVKEREFKGSLTDFVRIVNAAKSDKFTFLYIRNGEQLFRLSTEIEFGAKLFPDMDRQKLGSAKLYFEMFGGSVREKIITEDEYLAIVKEDDENEAAREKADEKDRWRFGYGRKSSNYEAFTQESVYYDDMARRIQNDINKHNQLVLVLQGLLDRSPVLHPHPPWLLWTASGFSAALNLVFDDSRTLPAGAKPDFETYCAKLNASLKEGSITVGQEDAWERVEAVKENERERARHRGHERYYEPSHYRPPGNPGPGKLARVTKVAKRSGVITYEWLRERQTPRDPWRDDPKEIHCSFRMNIGGVLNVDAYKPGDYKIFFNDPRTRADYLKWAPMLLEAEEYHAGNRTVAEPPGAKPKREPDPEAQQAYRIRKQCKALYGKAVRLVRGITTRSGKEYAKGSLWRVYYVKGQKLSIRAIDEKGVYLTNTEGLHTYILDVNHYDLREESAITFPKKIGDEDD